MAGATKRDSHGCVMTFGSSGFSMLIKSISINQERAAIDVTHMGSTAPTVTTNFRDFGGMEYIPAVLGDASYDITGLMDTGLTTVAASSLINHAAETVDFEFPQTGMETEAKFSGSGFCTSFAINMAGPGNAAEFSMTIQLSGVQTGTAAA